MYQTGKRCVTSLTENYISRFELEKLCRWLDSIKFWISMQEKSLHWMTPYGGDMQQANDFLGVLPE